MTPSDRYLTFARAERPPKTPLLAQVNGKVAADGVVVLRIYDVIDSWGGPYGVSAKEVADVLDSLGDEVTELRVHINSPGGESTEGFAILNLLRQHPANVVVIVDGLAASAASYIACAGELVMAPNSELMVHDAWGVCVGNAADMAAFGGVLDHLSNNIASVYAAKASGTVEAWRQVMAAETWFSAEEAVAAKLADRVLDSEPTEAGATKARFDLSVFSYAGRAKAPAPAALAAPQAPATTSVSGSTENPEESMSLTDAQVTDLRNRLGITDENADGDTILAALDEALTEHAPPAASITPPDGTVLVDAAQFAALQAAATEGQQARAQQLSDRRMALVNAAIADGRVAPAQRDAWVAKLAAEGESAEGVLASLAKGLVPVAALGHAGDPDLAEDDAIFAALFGADTKVSG